MLRLKDRNRSIPNGYQFYLPELKWSAPGNYPSFRVVTDSLYAVIQANPFLAQKHSWPTDRAGVENWVDTYNATICAKMGWDDYIFSGGGGGSFPKAQAPALSLAKLRDAAGAAKKLLAGAKTLIGWLESGEAPVDRDLATKRAEICSQCPHNSAKDFGHWFTVPVSELIRQQLQKLSDRSISTVHDPKLNLCDICLCPLKLKVHTPMKWIKRELPANVLKELSAVPNCWVAGPE